MSIAVVCPRCEGRYEIANDPGEQPIHCQKCLHAFTLPKSPLTTAIQPGTPPREKAAATDAEPMPPPRRPTPRSPFPWASVSLVVIGVLFLLLVISVGLNVWISLGMERDHFRHDQLRVMEAEAMRQRALAEEQAARARQEQLKVQHNWEDLRRQNVNLKREVEILTEQLDEARALAKGKN